MPENNADLDNLIPIIQSEESDQSLSYLISYIASNDYNPDTVLNNPHLGVIDSISEAIYEHYPQILLEANNIVDVHAEIVPDNIFNEHLRNIAHAVKSDDPQQIRSTINNVFQAAEGKQLLKACAVINERGPLIADSMQIGTPIAQYNQQTREPWLEKVGRAYRRLNCFGSQIEQEHENPQTDTHEL